MFCMGEHFKTYVIGIGTYCFCYHALSWVTEESYVQLVYLVYIIVIICCETALSMSPVRQVLLWSYVIQTVLSSC